MTPPQIGTYWGNSFWNQQAQVPATSVGAYSSDLGLLPLNQVISSAPSLYGSTDTSLFPAGASFASGNNSAQVNTSSLLRTLMFIQQMNQEKQSSETTCSDGDYDASFGKSLVKSAKSVVAERGSTVGACAKGVRLAMEKTLGESLEGANAHKWASKLAQRSDFKEITSDLKSADDLKDLPPGAIVVWSKRDGHEYGHVSIADGKGNEISDHKQSQITKLGGNSKGFRVFLPAENA